MLLSYRASVAHAWLGYKSRLNIISSPALRPVRSLAGDGNTSGSDDIYELARMLSQQAAKFRKSIDDEEISKSYDGFDDATRSGTFGLQQLGERVFREVGPGSFDSADFTELDKYKVMRDRVMAVFLPRQPMQQAVTVLLKEYLPVARAMALNELLILSKLFNRPEDLYEAAIAPLRRRPRVVPLLGYFVSPPSAPKEAASVSLDSAAASVWLVYRYEKLMPLYMYLGFVQPPEGATSYFRRTEVAEAEAWRARYYWLRVLSRALLDAVSDFHDAGVTHGSISSRTVLLSSTRDANADALVVKLENFGFGRLEPVELYTTSRKGQKNDLQAVALTLLEVYCAGTFTSTTKYPIGPLTRTSLERLLFETYRGDVAAFRLYCAADPSLSRLVAFLDEGRRSGWELIAELLRGHWGATALLHQPFFHMLNSR
ncbi:hypothetical protein VOLCADRAFT_108275 [Volvox carteri f. nagariensis]|uniref:Protein kinase domain-containing protein n=1 Tax=Volvox carteri f. nagariensis TaxID=3068 RepID=D8UJ83_VOLCA|nr:uncharacterized protein VOLCADRAFT_108275 [Volvox carteri f. nagariensis]EFJ40239.1 hypothetical protein VOLCADRAFT_108275 [Volvox carteri f. nagariensis]|eukprot:XP_002958719.1 hypothetical protein VOLCADRAFT_108275 [Volvox carteri f. nagariensis]